MNFSIVRYSVLFGLLFYAATGVADVCGRGAVQLRADFPGGALGSCLQASEREFVLRLSPENTPINPSPWYSFAVDSQGEVKIRIEYGQHKHRYQPKFSLDQRAWQPLSEDRFQVGIKGKTLELRLDVEGRVYVSSQELITSHHYDDWIATLAERYAGVQRKVLGHSAGGRPVWAFETNPAAENTILLIGRQHPPEVTGALAMFAFVDRLLEFHPDSCLSVLQCGFYRHTNIVVIPLINPDGVDLGHWRHNLGGVDLNRDWQTFSQPETQALKTYIDDLAQRSRIRLLLDFHSTYRNVFYTQDAGYKTSPADFASRWLGLAEKKGSYEIEHALRRTTQLGTSKNYINRRFGVPAITYELGDETPRQAISESAKSLADAMVEVLYPYQKGFDFLLKGGTVVDGTGAQPRQANVAVHGDRIVYVGSEEPAAQRVIDARGLLVTPGFIDPHTHTRADLINPEHSLNAPYLYQGVTSVFIGNDGDGRAFESEAATIRRMQPGTNVGLWRGHNALRSEYIGAADRPGTEAELLAMERALAADMQAGALGLSSGLFYAPGSFAGTEEVVRLAKVAAELGGRYDTHLRDEADYSVGLLDAVREAIAIGRQANIPTHIAHIKTLGPAVHGQALKVINLIDQARADGVVVTADQYPWLASGTRLSNALVPRWAQAGGRQAMLRRFEHQREELLREAADNLRRRGGADKLLITGESEYQGKTLSQAAVAMGVGALDAALEIVAQGDPAVASFMMNPEDVQLFMRQPWVVTGSDGSPGHPRKYATFPQKYQRFVRELGLLSLEAFVHQSSGKTATTFNLCERGVLALSKKADIAVWHPAQFQPRANYQSPAQFSDGVVYLLVNGELAIDQGRLTSRRNGQIIYARDC